MVLTLQCANHLANPTINLHFFMLQVMATIFAAVFCRLSAHIVALNGNKIARTKMRAPKNL